MRASYGVSFVSIIEKFYCIIVGLHRNWPDNKVHGANMGPTWVLPAPDGPHVGHINLTIKVILLKLTSIGHSTRLKSTLWPALVEVFSSTCPQHHGYWVCTWARDKYPCNWSNSKSVDLIEASWHQYLSMNSVIIGSGELLGAKPLPKLMLMYHPFPRNFSEIRIDLWKENACKNPIC